MRRYKQLSLLDLCPANQSQLGCKNGTASNHQSAEPRSQNLTLSSVSPVANGELPKQNETKCLLRSKNHPDAIENEGVLIV
jgi:hypothetical protein